MIRIAIIIALFGCGFSTIAQTGGHEEANTGSSDTDITVTEAGARTIVTPSKKSKLPTSFDDSIVKPPKGNYSIEPKRIETSFDPEAIKPVKLKVNEPLEKIYPGYVKVGIGNYLMPLADIYYGSKRSRKNNWGINIKHFSAANGPEDVGFSGFSENEVHANYKHFLKNHSLAFKADYERDVNYYYGFDALDTLVTDYYKDKNNIKAVYNYGAFSSVLQSYYKDSAKFNHKVGLNYYHQAGNYGNRENNFLAEGRISRYFGKELGLLDIDLDYNNYAADILPTLDSLGEPGPTLTTGIPATYNSAILRLTPAIETIRKNLKVRVGASIQVNTEASGFHFFPSAEAKYSLFNNIFIPYVGATGNVQRNSFRSITRENPFVASTLEGRQAYDNTIDELPVSVSGIQNTIEKYRVYGGFRGSVSSKVSFNVQIAQSRLNNMLMYVADTSTSIGNRFNLAYDNANKTEISGQLSYHNEEKLKVYVRGQFNAYKMDVAAQAWYKPNLELSTGVIYDMADKLIVRADLFFIGKRYYNELEEGSTTEYKSIKPVFDANLGVEYRYTERLSAFLDLKNLTTKKYQLWSNTPSQSINVLGGVTYRF